MKSTSLSSLISQAPSLYRAESSTTFVAGLTPVDDFSSTSQIAPDTNQSLKDLANTSYLMYEAVNDEIEAQEPIRPELQHMKSQIDAALVNRESLPELFVERMEIMQELYETLVTLPEDALLDLDSIEAEKKSLLDWLDNTKERQTFAKALQESLPTFVTGQELEKIGFTEVSKSEILDPSGQSQLIRGFSKPNTKGELDYVLLLDPLWIEPRESLPIGLFSEDSGVVSNLPIDIKASVNKGAVKAIILAETATQTSIEVLSTDGTLHDLYQSYNRGYTPPPRVQPTYRPMNTTPIRTNYTPPVRNNYTPPRTTQPMRQSNPQPYRPAPRAQPPRPMNAQPQRQRQNYRPAQNTPPPRMNTQQHQQQRTQYAQQQARQQTHKIQVNQQLQKTLQAKNMLKQETQRLQEIKQATQSRLRSVQPGIPVCSNNSAGASTSRVTPPPAAPLPSRPMPPPPPVKTYQQMRAVLSNASSIQQVRTQVNLQPNQRLTPPQKHVIPPARNQDDYRSQNVKLLQHVESTQKFSVRCNQVAQVTMREKANVDRIRQSVARTQYAQNKVYWTKAVEFRGNKVHQRNDLFDLNTMSKWTEKGQTVHGTNLERMKVGRAPIGRDGLSINCHHLIQTQRGAIAEVTASFHTTHTRVLHINDNSVPSGINRSEFRTWTKAYWKERAKDF